MKPALLFALMLTALVCVSNANRRQAAPQSKPDEIAKLINECGGARTTAMAGRLYNYTFKIFRLKPGYLFDKTNVAYPEGIADYGRAISQLAGRIWIDAADKVIVRLEASPIREATNSEESDKPDRNVALSYESRRLANGTWVPSEARYNSYGREEVFWKTPLKRSILYSDFKLFKTTADVEKTEPAASPTP